MATTIICCRRASHSRCKYCGRIATQLCDYPLRGQKEGLTCDAHLCTHCAVKQADGKEYCPPHGRIAAQQAAK